MSPNSFLVTSLVVNQQALAGFPTAFPDCLARSLFGCLSGRLSCCISCCYLNCFLVPLWTLFLLSLWLRALLSFEPSFSTGANLVRSLQGHQVHIATKLETCITGYERTWWKTSSISGKRRDSHGSSTIPKLVKVNEPNISQVGPAWW